MIQFEDLVAARILNQQLPQHRDLLLERLDQLAAGESQASLLASLVSAQLLSLDQARFIHETIDRDKRARALSLYAHLLMQKGVDASRVRQVMSQLVPDAGVDQLARSLVGVGVLTPKQDQQVRYEARLRTDHDRAEQVQAFLHSRPQVASDLPPNSSISGVIRLPDAPVGHHQAVPAAHAVKVSAMSVPILEESDLAAPRFVIPDFVDTSDARAGTRIKQYRLLGRIGAGGMGVVYLADSANDPERPVALKVCTGRDEEAHGRFKREILANSFISHPGIIDVYDAGVTDEGEDFLAMEFFDGEDMQEILDNDTKLEPSRAVDLSRQVFATLGAAHDAGVVHRDVKPENILVSRDGKTAKLMDFGIAIIRDLGEYEHMVFKTVEGGATGTPQFMSPEQAAGDKLTHSSDLYSMANVLYLALCGRLPFESESSGGFMACHMLEEPLPLAKADAGTRSLPKELHELLASLLDKNPANRPPSAAAVIEVLERILPQIGKASSGRLFGFLWRGRGG